MKTTIRIEGGQQLAATLNNLSKRLSNQVLRQALLKAGEPMRASAASMAPRAPGAPDIADHIALSPLTRRKVATVAMGPSAGARGDQAARTFGEQGFFLEYGTARMPAQPFMRPAFDKGARAAVRGVISEAWQILTRRGGSTTRGSGGGGGLL
jgi:HK97 gp10 family phage protein